MSESNFRLAEHQVEMTKHDQQQSENFVYFEKGDVDGERTDGYYMTRDRWEINGKPETIYVTVTAVIPTSEPADDKEVFRSAETGEFVSEEFAERNPSTTMKHSYEER